MAMIGTPNPAPIPIPTGTGVVADFVPAIVGLVLAAADDDAVVTRFGVDANVLEFEFGWSCRYCCSC